MTLWLVCTIGLFIASLVAVAVAAVRTFRQARRNMAREENRVARTEKISADWKRATAAAQVGKQPVEWDAEVQRINEDYAQQFAREGLTAPTWGNLDALGNKAALRVLSIVLEQNGWNLALLIAGPVLATAASIIGLFPGWRLPR